MYTPRHPINITCPILCQALVVALYLSACAAGEPTSRHPSNNPCGPHGEPWKNYETVVAQTVAPDGTVIDWVPEPKNMAAPPPLLAAPAPAGASPAQIPNTPVTTPLAGPPGTVPVAHPKVLTCNCDPGYIARPGQPCAELSQNCEPEGASASGKNNTQCCPGLNMVRDARVVNGQCVDYGFDYGICARCGDGVCGKGETPCNCVQDCRS